MNRRGFFGLLGKLLAVGTAMGVAPQVLAPLERTLPKSESFGNGTISTITQAEVTFTYPKPDYTLAE